jgi:lysyl-tRNA synthetase class I
VRALTPAQRSFLARVVDAIDGTADADALAGRLYAAARKVGLVADDRVSKDAFAAIYVAFLGRPIGPNAASLLVTLDAAFVRARLQAASREQAA